MTDAEGAFSAVSDDVVRGLSRFFSPDGDPPVRLIAEFESKEAIRNERFVTVPWVFTAVHDGEPFDGITADPDRPKPVTISGVTIFDERERVFYRFVDWMALLAQLGIMFSTRPMRGGHRDITTPPVSVSPPL